MSTWNARQFYPLSKLSINFEYRSSYISVPLYDALLTNLQISVHLYKCKSIHTQSFLNLPSKKNLQLIVYFKMQDNFSPWVNYPWILNIDPFTIKKKVRYIPVPLYDALLTNLQISVHLYKCKSIHTQSF